MRRAKRPACVQRGRMQGKRVIRPQRQHQLGAKVDPKHSGGKVGLIKTMRGLILMCAAPR